MQTTYVTPPPGLPVRRRGERGADHSALCPRDRARRLLPTPPPRRRCTADWRRADLSVWHPRVRDRLPQDGGDPQPVILSRLANQLKRKLANIVNSEQALVFGDTKEEIFYSII